MNDKKKIKIGIMTFHASHNCGSILQAYALQKIIKRRYSDDCKMINFSNPSQQRMYSVICFPHTFKQLIRFFLNLLFYKNLKKQHRSYDFFIRNNLDTTNEFFENTNELKRIADIYDVLICGSDQVWNTKCFDADDAYFLNFSHNTKKVAYAVSMAANNILGQGIEIENKYRGYIEEFYAISVREYNAKLWLEELTNKEIHIAADPTLLLSESEWNELSDECLIDGDYIFWYAMTYKENVRKAVLEISKKTNMPVYVIDAKEWSRRGLFRYGIKLIPGGPSTFLSLIKNSKLVLTSSFHGTVFSTLFKKDFWYMRISENVTKDDRASFLLKQLGLSNRYVSIKEIHNYNMFENIDYEKVKIEIEQLQKNSYMFLDNALL